jgi:hypothetical protein
MKDKILIIGKIPPPVGGVTVHVSRLLEQLKITEYSDFYFLDLNKTPVLKIALCIFRSSVIHLHTSNPGFQFLVALIARLTGTKLLITFHGNIGRYGKFKNVLTALSCKMCTIPIVQNKPSLQKALRFNPAAVYLSAYIPAATQIPLQHTDLQKIKKLKSTHQYLFCTNASTLSFDKYGKEIYGISELIQVFMDMPQAGLIISDPSEQYSRYIDRDYILPRNICFISGPHDFLNILDHADAMIRNTTTDGDSISVHEAIEKRVVVFASDCVPRPGGCRIYEKISDLDLISEVGSPKVPCELQHEKNTNVTDSLCNLYSSCINK